jgi:hypothetical protein
MSEDNEAENIIPSSFSTFYPSGLATEELKDQLADISASYLLPMEPVDSRAANSQEEAMILKKIAH